MSFMSGRVSGMECVLRFQVSNGAAAQEQAKPQASAVVPAPAKPKPAPDTATAVGIAVGHINSGQIDQALALLDEIIASSKAPNIGALVSRGTARALKRDLKGAFFPHIMH